MSYPEEKIMKETNEEQRESGVPEVEIQTENAEFANQMANVYFDALICEINATVSKGINSLSFYQQWPNLGKIAIHAMEERIRACENTFKDGCKISGKMVNSTKCHKDILKMSIPELKEIVKPEFLKKYNL